MAGALLMRRVTPATASPSASVNSSAASELSASCGFTGHPMPSPAGSPAPSSSSGAAPWRRPAGPGPGGTTPPASPRAAGRSGSAPATPHPAGSWRVLIGPARDRAVPQERQRPVDRPGRQQVLVGVETARLIQFAERRRLVDDVLEEFAEDWRLDRGREWAHRRRLPCRSRFVLETALPAWDGEKTRQRAARQ